MRILYVIDSLKFGGAEMLLLAMAQIYSRQGHEIQVAYFTPGPLSDDLGKMNIPLHRLSSRGIKDPRALTRLIGIIRDFKPDVLHTHLFKSDVTGQIAGALAGVPARVSSEHNINPWRKKPLYNAISKALMSPAHRIIAVSGEVRDYLKTYNTYPDEKVVVIDNGIDLERFNPATVEPLDKAALWNVPADALLVSVVGRLEEQKGHSVLIDAAKKVVEACPQARFVLVGAGPLRESLEAQRSALGLDEYVIFAGIQRDMPRVMKTMDVIVFSSLWEGLPVALLEAMAMQRPLLSTAVGGVPGVITPEVNGLLIPPGDADALAQGLIRLLNDPALRERLGKAGRSTIHERYSAAGMHEQIMNLYQSILARRNEPVHDHQRSAP
jgi:glycosyltransferase involved in cell wall biosynthesis